MRRVLSYHTILTERKGKERTELGPIDLMGFEPNVGHLKGQCLLQPVSLAECDVM